MAVFSASLLLAGRALLGAVGPAEAVVSNRSAFCHVTDGAFTNCGAGHTEWSDVPPLVFAPTSSWLYADQADLDPARGTPLSPVDTFMLMYDECGRHTPLAADEYFALNFDTVEVVAGVEKLIRYTVHVFANRTIVFLENGVVQTDGAGRSRVTTIDGQRGDAGFGPSPTCAFNHLVVEYQIDLTAAGGHSYSPDPIYWSGTPPDPNGDSDGDGVPNGVDNCPSVPNPGQADANGDGVGDACPNLSDSDSDHDGIPDFLDNCPTTPNPDQQDVNANGVGDVCEGSPDVDSDGAPNSVDNCPFVPNSNQLDADGNGIGDACQSPGQLHSTAAILQALLDGRTLAEPVGLRVADEPSLADRLVRIVDFRVAAGLTPSAEDLVHHLVTSLVDAGLGARPAPPPSKRWCSSGSPTRARG